MQSHIGYRDSTLTRVLQPCLGANCRTAIILTCSPSLALLKKTLNTCRFGATAIQVFNHATANVKKLKRVCKENMEEKECWARLAKLDAEGGLTFRKLSRLFTHTFVLAPIALMNYFKMELPYESSMF